MRLAAALLLVLTLAGCGGSDERADTPPRTDPPRELVPTTPVDPPDGVVPPDVPTDADGPAPKGAAKVVRAWAAAVRRADFEAAADLFASGALVQNGGPAEPLKTRDHAMVFNATLPCGAEVTALAGANGFTIADFRLTDRVGATCGSGRGKAARVAFRIRDGKIAGWYRLAVPDPGPTV